jgi:hypothetical protein
LGASAFAGQKRHQTSDCRAACAVDELDLIGFVDDTIGHAFVHIHAGNVFDDVSWCDASIRLGIGVSA